MDTSLQLSSVSSPAAQQAVRAVREAPAATADATLRAERTADSQPSVQVTLSNEARRIQQAEQGSGQTAAPVSVPPSVVNAPPVQASSAASSVTGTANSTAAAATPPVATPAPTATSNAGTATERSAGRVAEASGTSVAQASRPADASSAASSQAIQLYRDNAERPPAQVGPSAVRASA